MNKTTNTFNMQDNHNLRRRIMRRVYAIWFAKKLLSPKAVKAYIFTGLVVQVLGVVSVRSVIANSPSLFDIPHTSQFLGNAFVNTDVVVQLSLSALILITTWTFYDMFRRREYCNL